MNNLEINLNVSFQRSFKALNVSCIDLGKMLRLFYIVDEYLYSLWIYEG